jgi:hypothetical protein
LQSAGSAGGAVAGAVADGDSDGGADWVGAADCAGDADVSPGPAELLPGTGVDCACGWLGPHPLSSSAAAAAAVVMANPCELR